MKKTTVEQYAKVKLKSGEFAIITDVLETNGIHGYIAEVEQLDGDYEVEDLTDSDIEYVYVEVKTPLSEYMLSDMRAKALA
ncbi:MAG: hypothetical protein LBM98_00990 [Oscillospiraceae bacterium]|jgi:hypothetical protein|nr:hypothetical protein [Oscillospiraceae bacterium]